MNEIPFSNLLEEYTHQKPNISNDNTITRFLIDLWEIIEEAIDVLNTIDIPEFISSLDLETVRNAVDLDRLPGSIASGSISEAIDLSKLFESTRKRELLEAVDVLDLAKETDELRDEIDDVTPADHDEDVSGPGIDFDPSDLETTIQDAAIEGVQQFRTALLTAHNAIRELVEENRDRFGSIADKSPHSRNPTAVSLLPRTNNGMVTSAHPSTIPRRVRHGSIVNEPQIYGRRFELEVDS